MRSMPIRCGLADVRKTAEGYACAKCGKTMPAGYAARVLAYAGARELKTLERRKAPNVQLSGGQRPSA